MTIGDLYALKETASSKCFGIKGVSRTQVYVIRAIYPTTTTTNYFITKLSYASFTLSTSSYNMDNKIDIGIILEKAYSKVD